MSLVINANYALIGMSLAVTLWCCGVVIYAVWTTDRSLRLSLARLTEAFGVQLIESGKRMRQNQKS
jgi:uncharacterized membrane protein